jgi:hypothetical protein
MAWMARFNNPTATATAILNMKIGDKGTLYKGSQMS